MLSSRFLCLSLVQTSILPIEKKSVFLQNVACLADSCFTFQPMKRFPFLFLLHSCAFTQTHRDRHTDTVSVQLSGELDWIWAFIPQRGSVYVPNVAYFFRIILRFSQFFFTHSSHFGYQTRFLTWNTDTTTAAAKKFIQIFSLNYTNFLPFKKKRTKIRNYPQNLHEIYLQNWFSYIFTPCLRWDLK